MSLDVCHLHQDKSGSRFKEVCAAYQVDISHTWGTDVIGCFFNFTFPILSQFFQHNRGSTVGRFPSLFQTSEISVLSQ